MLSVEVCQRILNEASAQVDYSYEEAAAIRSVLYSIARLSVEVMQDSHSIGDQSTFDLERPDNSG